MKTQKNPYKFAWRRPRLLLLMAGCCVLWLSPPAPAPPTNRLFQRYRHAINDPLGRQQSQVFEIYGEYSVRGLNVHVPSVRRMVNTGIKKVSGEHDLKRAWRYFLHDSDIIALVFTREANRLGTNRDLAAGLLESLYSADFKAKNIMLIGLDELPDNARQTIPWHYGWQKEKINIGSDSVYPAAWLNQVTAIINVPSIMDDNIIGLRGTLANLSLRCIKRPARFYRFMKSDPEGQNTGDPFIPEIYALPQIRGKVRLHIANTLRLQYHGGPDITHYIAELRTMIFSIDPVALDRVSLSLLNGYRKEKPLPDEVAEKIRAPYLITAQAMGLGYHDLNFIQFHHNIRHEK